MCKLVNFYLLANMRPIIICSILALGAMYNLCFFLFLHASNGLIMTGLKIIREEKEKKAIAEE